MVVFHHPDDAEIGSGGVIATWVAAGCEVSYVLCTNGDAGTADRDLAPPTELARKRAHEQRAAADFMGVRATWRCWAIPTGEFEEDTLRALGRRGARHPPSPAAHRLRPRSLSHEGASSTVTTARPASPPPTRSTPMPATTCTSPSTSRREGLEPHKVRELWYWGADEPDVIVDVTPGHRAADRRAGAPPEPMPGFNVPEGVTIGERVKKGAAELAGAYGFEYGAVFRRLIARR